jgi:hypothetical protein
MSKQSRDIQRSDLDTDEIVDLIFADGSDDLKKYLKAIASFLARFSPLTPSNISFIFRSAKDILVDSYNLVVCKVYVPPCIMEVFDRRFVAFSSNDLLIDIKSKKVSTISDLSEYVPCESIFYNLSQIWAVASRQTTAQACEVETIVG